MMIQHVTLEVRREDVDAEVAFWELLGFTEVDPPEALRPRFRWVRYGAVAIHIAFIEEPVVPDAGHTAFVCKEFDETVARLRGAGYEATPRSEYWDAPRTIVRSPAGHGVELMAFMPPE